jgi:hypothetical protein
LKIGISDQRGFVSICFVDIVQATTALSHLLVISKVVPKICALTNSAMVGENVSRQGMRNFQVSKRSTADSKSGKLWDADQIISGESKEFVEADTLLDWRLEWWGYRNKTRFGDVMRCKVGASGDGLMEEVYRK